MLIGLLAKNAILIVQFALERRQTGMAIKYSAILGAGARLRPILMTSLAMVIGLLPMMFAMGVGANGNRTLGAAAVGGMGAGNKRRAARIRINAKLPARQILSIFCCLGQAQISSLGRDIHRKVCRHGSVYRLCFAGHQLLLCAMLPNKEHLTI